MKFSTPIIFVIALLTFSSCEEVGPEILLTDPEVSYDLIDTSYVISDIPQAQEQKVLVEDFTGVKCVNCPKGHEQVKLLQDAYPGRVIAVALHSNFLATPYGNDQDLRCSEAQSLDQRLGPTIAKPTGAINRTEVGGEQLFFINQWAQYCADEINKNNKVNIDIQNTTENQSIVRVKAKIVFLENMQEALSISVFLLESDIEVTQLTPGGEVDDYIHNHVLRQSLTPFSGTKIDVDEITTGLVVEKEFELNELDTVWNTENLEVVVLVHQASGNLKVFQSATLEL